MLFSFVRKMPKFDPYLAYEVVHAENIFAVTCYSYLGKKEGRWLASELTLVNSIYNGIYFLLEHSGLIIDATVLNFHDEIIYPFASEQSLYQILSYNAPYREQKLSDLNSSRFPYRGNYVPSAV